MSLARQAVAVYLALQMLAGAGVARARDAGDIVTYDVLVTDDAGKPLEGAMVWALGDTITRQDFVAEDLARLVRTFGQDVDHVHGADLHPHLRAWRTDLQGRLRFDDDPSLVGGLKRVRRHFAAFKRGHLPALVSDEARPNTTREIRLRLAPDPQARVDPVMLELDRLQARAWELSHGPLNHERGVALKAIGKDMRAIASDLEARGLAADAGAVYLALANLPSVDIGKDSAGQTIIIGYTNKFDPDVAWRVADRDRALRLTQHPMLAYQVMWTGWAKRKLDPLATGESAVRGEYVRETQALLATHGERLWPTTRYYLWQALIREKDFPGACQALRDLHASEPSLFHRERWQRFSTQYRDDVRAAGGPKDARCELPLPKR